MIELRAKIEHIINTTCYDDHNGEVAGADRAAEAILALFEERYDRDNEQREIAQSEMRDLE